MASGAGDSIDVEASPIQSFERGHLVWVKWHGFPWWPARITGKLREEGYPVRFFHTGERLFVKDTPKTLIAHTGSHEDLVEKGQAVKSKTVAAKFVAALRELAENPQTGYEEDPPEPPRAAEDEEGWLEQGSEYLGRRVARPFPGGTTVGRIMRWLPAGDEPDEPMLFHVRHDDGDGALPCHATPDATARAHRGACAPGGLHTRSLAVRGVTRALPPAHPCSQRRCSAHAARLPVAAAHTMLLRCACLSHADAPRRAAWACAA